MSQSPHFGRRGCLSGRKAFTLIELLIVIAIIALLVSILLPALSGAKEHARAAVCSSSMRRFTTGVMTYTTDNRGLWLLTGNYDTYKNGSSVIGSERDFAVRLAQYTDGKKLNPDPSWTRDLKFWDQVVKSGMFFCPTGPDPSTIKDPFNFQLVKTGSIVVSARPIVGTSIVPNARFSPCSNYRVTPEAKTVDRLTGAADKSLLCIDGTELGCRTWGDGYRSGYLGEYADPMFRHFSKEKCIENMDQGYSAPSFGGDAANMPRGNGKVNIGFVDGHVGRMNETDLRNEWEGGTLNPTLK